MPFTFKRVENIPDLIIIEPRVFPDDRGFFMETYKKSDFHKNGIDVEFVQDNHSKSTKGTIRALHYQINPKAQGKLVRVLSGKVWDVAVDIRKSSPTFLKWYGVELSDENSKMFYIPPGFAHGFITISETAHFYYKCTNEYSKEHEKGIRWNDPEINIDWNIDNCIMSDRDKNLPLLKDAVIFE